MTKYAIPACEQDGLHMRGFCFFINAKDGMTPDDVLEAIKQACVEYCSTPEGRKVYEDNCKHFNYGDFDTYVPNSICKNTVSARIRQNIIVLNQCTLMNRLLICGYDIE